MEIFLTPELEDFIHNEVTSGRFNSAGEVVAEALRLLDERDRGRVAQIAEFNRELERRLASLDAGQSVDPAAALARIQRTSAERRKKTA
jgi:antitoxin ParD1/3/4